MREDLTIGIVGAGGDGVAEIGKLISAAADLRGYGNRLSLDYGPQMKGGGSSAKITLSVRKDYFPKDELDILVCLSAEQFQDFRENLVVGENTLIFFEEASARDLFGQENPNLIQVSFSVISQELTQSSRNKNIVVFGLLLGMAGLGDRELKILDELQKMAKILAEKNMMALMAGMDEATKFWKESLILASPERKTTPTLVLDGNSAISKGALKAGCRFAATYPITPASEIGESLSRELPKIGGVYLQAEDEIAAACFVLGASSAGSKAMTATSGPGFDLMTETINLGSSCEIPMVIVNVQRAGPSTGMSTKIEQADLSAAIFSGHGYAPRVVLAPYDLESCYWLTIEAFNIAERYQVPVILLSDQYLAKTARVISDFTQKDCVIENRLLPVLGGHGKYCRYEISPDCISPMALPGMEGCAWRTTGLTHDEEGNPRAESSEDQQRMQYKITQKLESLRFRRDLFKTFGPLNAKIGLIAWGSSGEVSLAAVKSLGLEQKIKVCIPELISPMPKPLMAEFLHGLQKLIVVEMNYSGQYHGFLRRYFDLPKNTFLCKRAGGRPWLQKEIMDCIKEAGI